MRACINRRRFGLAAIGAAAACATPAAFAQGFPDKPLRILVGAPAGGTSDVLARLLADAISPLLGQPVLVDNKPGAAGILALQELLKAPRDGHTLFLAISGIVSEVPHAIRMPVDPMKELRPLVELGRTGLVFVGSGTLAARTLPEAIAHVKANRGKVSYASYSPGTLSHTLGLELNRAAGLDMIHVGYRGSPPALTDLVGGQVQFMFDGPATSIPMIKAGRIKAYATTAPKRMGLLPDVPTFEELGYKDLTAVGWLGLWSTPDVPAAAQTRVRDAALKAMAQPGVREKLAGLGLDPGSSATPDELVRSLKSESEKQAAILKAIGFKPD